MAYTINPSDDHTHIILIVKGDINRMTALNQNLEAHALGRKLGITRYFVDLTESRNTESVTDQYEFAYKDMRSAEGIDRHARIAVLVSADDHSHDFIETVARNSGLNFKLFADREKAMSFLME